MIWWFQEILLSLQAFMDKGGPVLWVIVFVAFLMWMLILERGWYMKQIAPQQQACWLDEWQQHEDRESWRAIMIREAIASQAKQALRARLSMIRVLVSLLPMLGLLGTVSGMIHVFDVMASLGTGNARAMASGIARATLPTMAGLVVAIIGLYFNTRLQSLARKQAEQFDNQLKEIA